MQRRLGTMVVMLAAGGLGVTSPGLATARSRMAASPAPVPAASRPADDAAAQAARAVADAWITAELRARLSLNDELDCGAVELSARDGVVTLTGELPSDDQRQRTLELARKIHGVVRVVDETKVEGAVPATAEKTSAAQLIPR